MPPALDRDTRRKIRNLEKKNGDLRALVDTLQIALRRADTAMQGHEEYDYVFTQSAKWAMSEKI